MPVDRDEWNRRIKAVERQHIAARLALERLRTQVQQDASIALVFPGALHAKETLGELDPTYLVRMFAVFENGLRSYWNVEKPGKKPDMKPLIDAIASRRKIPYEILKEAHEVREYRNQIVHARGHGKDVITIALAEARKRLILFGDRLPFEW